MTNKEAISILRIAIAEVEWEYPMDYAAAFEAACKALDEKSEEDCVPVVRCKSCRYWWKENELCTHPKTCAENVCALECGKEFFCAYGEKKS